MLRLLHIVLLGVGAWLAGCATTVPMQTASVLPAGAVRVGGELDVSPYCSVSWSPLQSCAVRVDALPLPQLKANLRHGLGHRTDVGLSLQLASKLSQGIAAGAYTDVKVQAWQRELGQDPNRLQIISLAPGVGFTSIQVKRDTEVQDVAQVDLVLPIYFGHQFEHIELVGSLLALQRFTFIDLNQDFQRDFLSTTELGAGVGLFTRGTWRFGAQLSYQAPVGFLATGPFTLAVGVAREWGASAPEP